MSPVPLNANVRIIATRMPSTAPAARNTEYFGARRTRTVSMWSSTTDSRLARVAARADAAASGSSGICACSAMPPLSHRAAAAQAPAGVAAARGQGRSGSSVGEIGADAGGHDAAGGRGIRPLLLAGRERDPGRCVGLDDVRRSAARVARALDHLHGTERRHPDLDRAAGRLLDEQLQQIPHRGREVGARRLLGCRGRRARPRRARRGRRRA